MKQYNGIVLGNIGDVNAGGKTINELKVEIWKMIKNVVGNYNGNLNCTITISKVSSTQIARLIQANNTTTQIVYEFNTGVTFHIFASPFNFSLEGAIYGRALMYEWYSGRTYLIDMYNTIWRSIGEVVLTNNGKNVANTWKLSSGNELVIDANNTATDQVIIGNTVDNYTGSGFKYIFKDGKGNSADVYANKYYGLFNGKAMALTTEPISDINYPQLNSNYTTSFSYTDGDSIDYGRKWYTFINSKLTTGYTQLGIPILHTINRIIVRGHGSNYTDSITTDFREIPYYDEVVTLTGNSTVTGTLNVPTQASDDNSNKVASTAFVQAAIAAALKAKGL